MTEMLRQRMARKKGIAHATMMMAIMLVGIDMVGSIGVVGRPNFGVVFSPGARLQNSGSSWVYYIRLPDVNGELIPLESRGDLTAERAYNVSPELFCNQAILDSYQGHVETIMRICEAFRPVLTKFNKQKEEIKAEIDSIQQMGTQRNKRGAPLEFVSSAA